MIKMKKITIFILMGVLITSLAVAGLSATLTKPDITKDLTTEKKTAIAEEYGADGIEFDNCYKKNLMNYCDIIVGNLTFKNSPVYHDGEKNAFDKWGNSIGSYTDNEMLEMKAIKLSQALGRKLEEKEVVPSLNKKIEFTGKVSDIKVEN